MVYANVYPEKNQNVIVLHTPNIRIKDPLRQRQTLLQKRVYLFDLHFHVHELIYVRTFETRVQLQIP